MSGFVRPHARRTAVRSPHPYIAHEKQKNIRVGIYGGGVFKLEFSGKFGKYTGGGGYGGVVLEFQKFWKSRLYTRVAEPRGGTLGGARLTPRRTAEDFRKIPAASNQKVKNHPQNIEIDLFKSLISLL